MILLGSFGAYLFETLFSSFSGSRPRQTRRPVCLVPTLAVILTLVLASSCRFPTDLEKTKPEESARVFFSIKENFGDNFATSYLIKAMKAVDSVVTSRALVFDPAPLSTDLLVYIEGTGPGAAVLEPMPVSGSTLELNLSAGDWEFKAKALDSENIIFLAGTAAAKVDPVKGAKVVIALNPVPGLGGVAVSYLAPAQITDSAVWNCSISDQEGSVVAAWEDTLDTLGRLVSEVPSGYYLLASRLMDGELTLAGRIDLVRVLTDRSTTVSIALEIPVAGLGLDMDFDDQRPVGLTAALLSRAAVRGLPLRVRAGGLGEFLSPLTFHWSAMGKPLAQGQLVDIPTEQLPRSGIIDLLAFSETSAGAAGLPYSLSEPELRAGWCLYASVGPEEEPASQVLGRPAMVGASLAAYQGVDGGLSCEPGTVLAVASDETSSKLELWLPDPDRGELVPGASALIKINGTVKKASVLAISADGSYVAAAASESSWIWLVPVSPEGQLGVPLELVGGSGELSGMGYVRGLAFSPNADHLYALSNADRSIYVFQRSANTWSLLQRFALDDQACGVLSVLKALAISPDGATLAVAAASSDAVVLLNVTASGLVWRSEARRAAGFPEIDYPQTLAFSPEDTTDGLPDGISLGGRLAIGCKDSAALLLLDIEAVPPEEIAVCGAPDGLPGAPTALSWSADGSFIGLATPQAIALIRLPADGQPQTVSVFDAADAAGLGAPAGLAMVGSCLYLASPDAQALVILARLPE